MSGSAQRVALFSESSLPYLSGVTVSVDALAHGLAAAGRQVLVAAPRPAARDGPPATGPAPAHAWLPSYQLPVLAPPAYRMPWPRPSAALGEVDRFRPQIVHAHSPFVSGQLAKRAARRARAPLVFTHHTRFADYRHYLGPARGLAARPLDRYLRRFWRSCAAVIAPSAAMADEIRRRLEGGRRPVVRALATGIDLAAIAALEAVDARPAHAWPPDAVVAVTLGRLAAEKGVGLLLEGFAAAAVRVAGLRLLVVGAGPAEAALRRRAAAADLRERVGFAGLRPRAEALALVRGADLFVFASRTETQGLVLAEALACGLPCVALDGPAIGETVRDGVDGWVVEPGGDEAAALGSAIAATAGDPERRARMARAAVEGARRFDLVAWVAAVAGLYDELLEAGG